MTTKDIELCGLGNAIVDILTEIPDSFLEERAFDKGSMVLVDPELQEDLLRAVGPRAPSLVSGGSVANSVIAFAQLGGKGGLIAVTGDDDMGAHYRRELSELGIEFSSLGTQVGRSGTSLVLITPDAERTMRTALGVSALLSDRFIDAELVRRSSWLFVEGYLFANPDLGLSAVKKAVQFASASDTRVALTLSASWVIATQREGLMSVLPQVNLLFANDEEACALAGTGSVEESIPKLLELVPEVVVTAGERGAFHAVGGTVTHVTGVPCTPVDMTGAGDMLAGAYLYGVTHGLAPEESLRRACVLAKQVICQVGARYRGPAAEEWATI